jgi:Rod binding domain-containing protein
MQVSPLQHSVAAADLTPEQLAHNSALSEQQKIAEVSRQFEAILIRQILSEAQKTVIPSKLADNSVSGGIYQDMITNQLADSISKSGAFGLASTFERQLSHQAAAGKAAETYSNPKALAAAVHAPPAPTHPRPVAAPVLKNARSTPNHL